MVAISRWAALIVAALMLWAAGAGEAQAQYFCRSNASCGPSSRCVTWIWPITRCEFFRCNADSECPTDRACLLGLCTRTACNDTGDCPRGTCTGGICRRTGGMTPTPPSGGAGGTGAKCGKIVENGQVRVYPACAATFQCRQGRCVRPEQ